MQEDHRYNPEERPRLMRSLTGSPHLLSCHCTPCRYSFVFRCQISENPGKLPAGADGLVLSRQEGRWRRFLSDDGVLRCAFGAGEVTCGIDDGLDHRCRVYGDEACVGHRRPAGIDAVGGVENHRARCRVGNLDL